MEETLGKRIAANRKRLGITQDRLAEQLGVTAQAVSKWENDQSCPDITMLPKLTEIFGISVDALLGLAAPEPETALEAEVVETIEKEDETEGLHVQKGNWEFRWDGGRKSNLSLAVWIILTAAWMFFTNYCRIDVTFWDLLWTNGLLVFGVFGLFPKFSFFRLGCALFGMYFLLDKLNAIPAYFGRELLLPAFLLLFGLSLLVDALRKPGKPHFSVTHDGKTVNRKVANCNLGEDCFDSAVSFGEDHHSIDLPRLRSGSADVSFGDLTVDLTGCEEFAPGCHIDANCSFGELTVLVPRRCRAEVNSSSSFGSVDISGNHDTETTASVCIDADVSFGEITIKYI